MTALERSVDVVALHEELAGLRELLECVEADTRAQRQHYAQVVAAQRDHIANLRLALAALHTGVDGPAATVLEAALRLDASRLERLGAARRHADERFIAELVAQRIAARRARVRERGHR